MNYLVFADPEHFEYGRDSWGHGKDAYNIAYTKACDMSNDTGLTVYIQVRSGNGWMTIETVHPDGHSESTV